MSERKAKRIYISGPITGNPNYQKDFHDAEIALIKAGYIPVNPAKVGVHLETFGFSRKEIMDFDFTLLAHCDGIYMMKGWTESDGAREELEYVLYTHPDFEILTDLKVQDE